MANSSRKRAATPRLRQPAGKGRALALLGAGAVFAIGIGLGVALASRASTPPPIAEAPSAQGRSSPLALGFTPPPIRPPTAPDGEAPARWEPPPRIPDADRPRPAALVVPRPPPVTNPRGGPLLIAIVIDDMGLDRGRGARAIALPGPLTMSFLPYGEGLGAQVEAARGRGHGILLHLPMEPEGNANPGPNALLTRFDAAENLRRLALNLDAFQGYAGVNNHMGSRFTRDAAAMAPVLAELKARGLYFLDSRTSARSVGHALALGMGLVSAERDVFLDNEGGFADVHASLARTEAKARLQGSAIAIGHPRDATLAALEDWLPKAGARGFTLVDLTTVVQRRIIVAHEAGDAARPHHRGPTAP